MKKFLLVVLTVALVLGFSTTALADSGFLNDEVVTGGPSKVITHGFCYSSGPYSAWNDTNSAC